MQCKTVFITGANSGIGKASSMALAKMGARVLMHARDEAKGNLAREEIIKESGNKDIDLFICDLADLEQVRGMAERINLKYPQIDVLINNAGIITRTRQETVQGFEYQFGVNHLSHFLLSQLLIDKIRKSPSGRIINVSSAAHFAGKIHFDDINLSRNYTNFRAYSQAKLANILFTNALCHRLQAEGITANSLHPGLVGTRFAHARDPKKSNLLMLWSRVFMISPEKGAETSVYLASSSEVEDRSGQYYKKMKPVSSSKTSYNLDSVQKLWDLSLEMTGLGKSLI